MTLYPEGSDARWYPGERMAIAYIIHMPVLPESVYVDACRVKNMIIP